jgi:hypothetical protein
MSRTLKIIVFRNRGILVLLLLVAVLVVVYTQVGLYSIQPMGVMPEGVTLLVRRVAGESFFNSPDAVCLRTEGDVSLLCRSRVLAETPDDRVILKFPFWQWAYQMSTGGKSFDY